MRHRRDLVLWVLAGVLGVGLLAWAWPRAFPFHPRQWSVSREEAVDIALARLTDLGAPVEDSYVVPVLASDAQIERRLATLPGSPDPERLRASGLPDQVAVWEVFVYPPGGRWTDWRYRAQISVSGEVLLLRLNLDPQEKGNPIDPQAARDRAASFLAAQGFDLGRYGEPEIRSQQLAARTDLTVRYPDRRALVGDGITHGVEVVFAGDRLAGFQPWMQDPKERQVQESLQSLQFAGLGRLVLVWLFLALLAAPFLKRYHEGEIGVRRGGQIFVLVAGCALLFLLMTARSAGQDLGLGLATREQTTWVLFTAQIVFRVVPTALLAFFAWSVGESICRERWGHKLAAFDALFQRDWANATVARSSLRGVAAGLFLAGAFTALLWGMHEAGATPLASIAMASASPWPGLEIVASLLAFSLPGFLVALLSLLPVAARHLGRVLGVLAAVVLGSIVLFPNLLAVPLVWGLLATLAFGVLPVVLFLIYDLLTALLAGFMAQGLFFAWPLLTAGDSSLRVQGGLALAVLAAPLVVSLRALGSKREFVYRYEDVAPHVRRIAERERQRVELETARRIQSSILPELPPRLHGVEIAHAYLPASEVGGDFYDVLALEDGRLAVAVGDVAGHGVSSGLIMAMAKSALDVQVTFDPDVRAVFHTLNRMVYQTARKRLLATLCYLLLDPRRREMVYASAGHLYPYRVTSRGTVEALESTAYPLGVRSDLEIVPRTAALDPGDILFLFSDGLVEARPEGRDEVFGFDRLEESLARHAHSGVEGLRDGVLADVDRFTGPIPREDDQTVLVLRLP